MSDEALVQVLWRHLDEPIRMALIAAQISKQLAGIARFDSARFANLALKYEGWATGVLSTCDHELEARWLLQQPFNVTVPGRTGGTLITLAIRTQLKGFIAHSHAQSLLDAWWRGDVVEAYDARTGAGGYCLSSSEPHALLVIAHAVTFGLLRLVQMEQTLGAKHAQKSKQHSQFAQVRRGALARLGKSSARDVASIFRQLQQEPTHRPDRLRALVDFYSAPKAKFWLRASSYLCFLLLYALVLILDDGTPDVSRLELAFALWTLGLAVDELHQWQTNRRLHRVHFDGIWCAAHLLHRIPLQQPALRLLDSGHAPPALSHASPPRLPYPLRSGTCSTPSCLASSSPPPSSSAWPRSSPAATSRGARSTRTSRASRCKESASAGSRRARARCSRPTRYSASSASWPTTRCTRGSACSST